MKLLKDLLNICVTLPNMDLFVFYFVFILLVPLLLLGPISVIKLEDLGAAI